MLDFLFNRRPEDPVWLYFKGGTSLSKAYGLIQRFSEDIDIGVYKADLKVPLEADIAALPSVNQQQKALAEQVDEASRQYIAGPLRDLLSKEIAAVEQKVEQSGHFTLDFGYDAYRKKEALDILILRYQSVFDGSGGYVEAAVRIEGGARPDPVPAEPREIMPYFSMLELAEACRRHKELMFRAPDRRYDRAVPGTFRLVPTADMRKKLEADYSRMSAMIFGTPPAFDAVMASIVELEHFLNSNMVASVRCT